MNIILNNRPEHIDKEGMTVRELLEYKNYTFKMLVIRINNELIKKDKYTLTEIVDGDQVSILHLISGG